MVAKILILMMEGERDRAKAMQEGGWSRTGVERRECQSRSGATQLCFEHHLCRWTTVHHRIRRSTQSTKVQRAVVLPLMQYA